MKVIRDRADAFWLPQRFRFAIFRLLAYVMFRRARRRASAGTALGVDRDQTALEHYTVAIWLTATMTLFAYAVLAKALVRPAAVVLAPIVCAVVLHVLVLWASVLPRHWRWSYRVDFNSFLTLSAVVLSALYFATESGWIRYVAWSVIATALANAAAASILTVFKTSILAATEDVLT